VRRVILLLAGCLGPVLELPPPRDPTAKSMHSEVPKVVFAKRLPARAFVMQGGLLGGTAADGQPGDFGLDNGIVSFVIAAADHVVGFADSGGHLIDAGPSGGQDALKQLFALTGASFPRQAVYERVETDQRDAAAVVRALGHDSEDKDLQIITEYALEPGARAVEITTTYRNGGSSALRRFAVGEAIEWGMSERFVPEQGFTIEAGAPREITTPQGWLVGVAPEVSYGYAVSGPLTARHAVGWSDVTLGELALVPGAAGRVKRWLVVSPTTDVALGEAMAALRGEKWVRITGRVVEEGSDDGIPGARLIFSDHAGRPLALAQSLSQGGYAQVAVPGDYLVSAEAAGRRGLGRVEVRLGEDAPTTLDVILSRPGELRFQVDEGGRPSPAKLTFFGIPPTRTPRLGSARQSPGMNILVSADGRGTVAMPPGRYHVVASRGPAFTVDEKDVEVTPGAAAEARFQLSRAVDLPGLVCVDLHQHAASSADSGVAAIDRLASNLAEGLEVVVATDHNRISGEYAAALEKLSPARPLLLVTGEEVTREGLGHFNVWPLAPGGAVDPRGKSVRQIVADMRAPNRVVVIDHPRQGPSGYFNAVGFDPHAAQLPRDWEGGFDAVEVWSGKDVSKSDAPLVDWMALANRGLLYTAVGGSDSHLVWGQEVGYPRTCVFVDGAPTAAALVQAIRQKREALVTNGPFALVSISGKGMGQLAAAPRGKVRVDVEVRAAPWVDAHKLEVFVNGERRGKPIDIPAGRGPVRYKGGHELKLDRDAAVVVIVRGETSLEPVLSRPEGAPAPLPLCITNPIFVDRDGDGRFTAPKAGPTKPVGRPH
jgi:hypothetical protein